MKVAAPLAQIASRTASVHLYGYVAVVHTVEMLMPGNDKKPLRKRGSPIPKPYKVCNVISYLIFLDIFIITII